MGFIFRAFFAPMDRLQTAQGVPTKVPFLFATMTRRIINNPKLRPDYIAVVFDVAAPTFRDKLFADYKAQRPPMPDELSIQVPFVRRYCEAMHFPIIEMAGYEADDGLRHRFDELRGHFLIRTTDLAAHDDDLPRRVESLHAVGHTQRHTDRRVVE